MATAGSGEIEALVDGQRFRAFNLSLLIWSFLATFTDGFELSALGFAVPHISAEWHVPPSAMGWMLSASLAGMFFGAPLLGLVGDRFGRRAAIAIGCLLYGITTLALPAMHSIGQITVLRFLTGIGMGGVLPNTIALSSELSPRRLRARLVILMFMGVTLGGSVPGLIAVSLVPEYGWRSIFVLGGAAATLVGLGCAFLLPESVKFLATRPDRREQLMRTLHRMRPDVPLPEMIEPRPPRAEQASIGALFSGGLAPVTLLLWLCFATTLLANFFLNNWLPTLFNQVGVSAEAAALTATMYHFGATLGGLAMSLILDRYGFLAIGVLLAVAAPAMVAIGIEGVPPFGLGLLAGFAGFCVLGGQFGSNAAAGLLYPTPCRARGLGLAFGVGRIGSVLGPILGARLIGLHLPMMTVLAAAAAPMLVGAVAAFALALIGRRRLGGWRLDELSSPVRDVGFRNGGQ